MKFIYSDEAKCCAKSIMANASAIRFHFSVKHEALSRNELNAHLKLLRLEAEKADILIVFGENNYFLSGLPTFITVAFSASVQSAPSQPTAETSLT